MKSSILRTTVALACAVSLASCGGGNTGTLYLAGTVSGVNQAGLVIQNNGGSDLTIPAGATTFQFTDLVPTDAVYNVTIKSQPPNVSGCVVLYGKGNTGLYSVSTVQVNCTIFTHALGGTITGLGTSSDLVLINGADKVAVPANATSFTMAPVSEGYPYGVTVLVQPAGKTCTVANGVGVESADYNGIVVTCTPT